MQIKILTSNGDTYLLKSVNRRHLDFIADGIEMPIPPERTVEVFGGEIETIPILNDPEYQNALEQVRLELVYKDLQLVKKQIEIVDLTEETKKLAFVLKGSFAALLRNAIDLNEAIRKLYYISTVTNEGILEASDRFKVTWFGKPITAWNLPDVPSSQSSLFRDFSVAKEFNYSWEEFCEFDGVQQSTYVAHRLLDKKLEYFTMKWMIQNTK